MRTRETKRQESRCKGRTKAGKPCRAAASEGGLCFFHANPEKASELGRIGGRSKCPTAGADADPLPTLDHATGLKDTLDLWIDEVRSGKLRPRVAAALVQLMSLRQRVIAADLERRMANLEKRFDEIDTEAAVTNDSVARQLDSPTSPSKLEEGCDGNADGEPTS